MQGLNPNHLTAKCQRQSNLEQINWQNTEKMEEDVEKYFEKRKKERKETFYSTFSLKL